MSTYARLTYHVIFSTKYRIPRIDEALKRELYAHIGGIIRGEKGELLEIGGAIDTKLIHGLDRQRPKVIAGSAGGPGAMHATAGTRPARTSAPREAPASFEYSLVMLHEKSVLTTNATDPPKTNHTHLPKAHNRSDAPVMYRAR